MQAEGKEEKTPEVEKKEEAKGAELQPKTIAKEKPEKTEEPAVEKPVKNAGKEKSDRESPKIRTLHFLYTASTFLVLTILVIGVTMINNYDQMKKMEQTMARMTEGAMVSGRVVETEKMVIDGRTGETELLPGILTESEQSSEPETDVENAGMAVNQSENAGKAVNTLSDGAEASGVQTGTLMDQQGSLGQQTGTPDSSHSARTEERYGRKYGFRPDPGAVSRYAAGRHSHTAGDRSRDGGIGFGWHHRQQPGSGSIRSAGSGPGPCKPGGLHGEIRRYPGRYLQPLLRFHGPPSGTL